jgi:hypothetical protein
MPRPDRIRAKEAAIKPGDADEDDEALEVNGAIDTEAQPDAHSRSGPVEDEDFIQSVAKRAGWSEDKERDGKPIRNWQDARSFLEKLPDALRESQDRAKRTTQMADAVAEEARQRGIREAREQLNGAIDSGDKDAAQVAAQKIAQHSGPPPQTVAFLARNPWFDQDPVARAAVAAEIERSHTLGRSIEQQLADGEALARKRFPEHFPDGHREEPRGETRLSDVQRPAAPMVTGGSRAGSGRPANKERGWNELPKQVRGSMEQFVKKAVKRGQTEDQSRSFLARAYWAEQA